MTIYVVGNCALDLVFSVDRFPEPGETVLASGRRIDLGGKGANQAVAARRFGVHVRLVAPVGGDPDGATVRKRIVETGLDPSGLVTVDAPTDVSAITVSAGGENTIVSTAAAAERLTSPLIQRSLATITFGDTVMLQGNLTLDATRTALTIARAAGAVTMLNPAPVRWSPEALWPLADIAVLNRVEARMVTGTDDPRQAVRLLRAAGVGTPVVSLGAEGLVALVGDSPFSVPAPHVTAVDTAGAGDVLCGTFAAALALGRGCAVSLRIASAAAALAVTRPGTQSAFPSAEEAAAILLAHP